MAKKASAKPRRPVEPVAEPPEPIQRGPVPGRLADLIGHDRAIATLRAVVASGRLHHAWVFAGPVGVGKFTAALAFARELLTPADDRGGTASRLLDAGTHPDLHVIVKELSAVSRDPRVRDQLQTNIPLEVVREFLTEPAHRTRVLSGDSAAGKVFIVDEAHLLSPLGQDALLKTLEEPPPGTVIILVTASEHDLSPTIRSRCQRVAFAPLDAASFGRWLSASGLGGGLAREDREFLESFAAGAPGVARVVVETGVLAWRRALDPLLADADRGRFSPRLGGSMAELAESWAKARAAENPRASKEAANRAAARWMFRLLGDRYRGALRAAVGEDAPAAPFLAAIGLIDDAERHADASVQLPFVFENLSAQLAGLTPRR